VQRYTNTNKAVKKWIKQAISLLGLFKKKNRERVSDKEFYRRAMICAKCQFRTKNIAGIGDSCGTFLLTTEETCGCKLSWKIPLANQNCKKWEKK